MCRHNASHIVLLRQCFYSISKEIRIDVFEPTKHAAVIFVDLFVCHTSVKYIP